jgi:thiamine-phosphate pyrophosphorylase
MTIDLRLYVVTDEPQTGDRGVPATVQSAIAGGATIVQLRDKTASTRALMAKARALLSICRPAGVPLLINDRVDVALASGADGVHLGQSDMEARDARRVLGPDAIIGVSIRNEAEIEIAQRDGATYLAANGVWTTATKTDFGAPLGCDGLRKLVSASRLPMVAIGGIGVEQAPMIAEAGCAGIAVVSAVMKAPDPRLACMALRRAFGR